MGVAERGRVLARRDQTGEMGHVDHEDGVDLIGDGAEAGEVDMARIGRAAGDDQARAMLLRERLDLLEVDAIVVAANAILDGVEPFARHRRLGAVGEVAAGVQRHSENGVARLGQSQHHRSVRLSAAVRLDVDEPAAEQLLRPLDRQSLDRVRRRATLIVTAARIALSIFVGEHRALRLEHRPGHDILRGDQLDLILLPVELGRDRFGDGTVGFPEAPGEEARMLDIGEVEGGACAHAFSLAKTGLESLSTRRW